MRVFTFSRTPKKQRLTEKSFISFSTVLIIRLNYLYKKEKAKMTEEAEDEELKKKTKEEQRKNVNHIIMRSSF